MRADPEANIEDLIHSERGASLFYDRYTLTLPEEEDDISKPDEVKEILQDLYSDSRINEQVDQVTGIKFTEFAKLKKQM